ncbi:MAG TPA: 16S rRNA (adenine(1518)-N(6)/adenine(1519)-N(6))-dimethyltransferase RsmA [Sphingomicrobium sp.]|nr:16S rRNA (adenine(1518)-N(6)/adenine(1519)-N(6))-dimethyltransferase RsmA [Sphingomicrobium sp.]
MSGDPGPSSQPEALREVIARHGLSASKALGQNFILDRKLLGRIAAIPRVGPGDRIYEVGPGPGGLTRALLDTGAHVIAVERDRRCLPALDELANEYAGKLRLIEGDALEIDERSEVSEGARIVANLPYNIGTALLLRWLGGPWPPWWRSLTLMFQREVAERIVAAADSEHYGRLAIAAQWRADARIAMTVHRSAFTPPPKIASAVVHLTPIEEPPGINPAVLERVTAAAFGQRRKMLRQSLKTIPDALDALDELGIDSTRRAETLTVANYVALARKLS